MIKSAGLNTVKNSKFLNELESPDCRNMLIGLNSKSKTRPGMVKYNGNAISSGIYGIFNLKSDNCNTDYKIVWTGDGRMITDPQDLISVPQKDYIVSYWKFEEASGTVYDETANNNDGTYKRCHTRLLLHLNGTDGATSTIDSSESAHAFTFYGNAQIHTADKKFGASSCLFDGIGDYLDTPDHADWDMGNGDFATDMWIKTSGNQTERHTCGQLTSAGSSVAFYLYIDDNGKMIFNINDGSSHSVTSTTSVNDDTWHHIAGVRYNNEMKLYIDGISEGTPISGLGTIPNRSTKFSIGRNGEYDGQYFHGWIDEFRITKGLAKWTSNFTPPTSEYIPTEPYQQPGKIGYALDFSDDVYVEVPDDSSLDLFTGFSISGWVKPNSFNNYAFIASKYLDNSSSPTDDGSYRVGVLSTQKGEMGILSNYENYIVAETSNAVFTAGKWTHIVGVWDGGNTPAAVKIYIDGVNQDLNTTEAGNFTTLKSTGQPFRIGTGLNGQGGLYPRFDGTIDEVIVWNKALTAAEIATYLNWDYVY